jgi:hypothetical protein
MQEKEFTHEGYTLIIKLREKGLFGRLDGLWNGKCRALNYYCDADTEEELLSNFIAYVNSGIY